MSVRITCIRKDGGNHQNPHEGITDFGWVNEQTRAVGETPRLGMVRFLDEQGGSAYVRDSMGNVAYVATCLGISGIKYLRTYADRQWTDNLLSLPEC